MNTEQPSRNPKKSHHEDTMRALPGERTKILSKKQRIFGLVVQMNTDLCSPPVSFTPSEFWIPSVIRQSLFVNRH